MGSSVWKPSSNSIYIYDIYDINNIFYGALFVGQLDISSL